MAVWSHNRTRKNWNGISRWTVFLNPLQETSRPWSALAFCIAPTAILRACSCYDKESIKVLCNMSNEAAEHVIGDITRDYNVRERERVTLECQFDSFIRRKEYLLLISPEFCSVCGSPFSLNDSYCRMCGRHISSHATHEDSFLYPTTIHLN